MRLYFLVALACLASLAAAQDFTRVVLECPGSTLSSETFVHVTYYLNSAPDCGNVTLSAVVSGTVSYNSTSTCNEGNGHYSFNVSTGSPGVYTITALTPFANATCTFSRPRAEQPSSFPDLPIWLAPLLALAAIGLLRTRANH